MDKKLILILLITALILGVYLFVLIITAPEPPPYRNYCETVEDCTPDAFCHPKNAVNKYYTPKSNGPIGCTLDCSGPLDCGGGRIECRQNQCVIIATACERKPSYYSDNCLTHPLYYFDGQTCVIEETSTCTQTIFGSLEECNNLCNPKLKSSSHQNA